MRIEDTKVAISSAPLYQLQRDDNGKPVRDVWPAEGCDKKRLNDQRADLAILQFEDSGELLDPSAVQQVVKMIATNRKSNKNGVILVLYTHGWNHDASPEDSNLQHFEQMLIRLALRESERYGKNSTELGRRVIGVYAGWRGKLHDFGLLQMTTFWARYDVAKSIGASDTFQTSLRDLLQVTRSHGSPTTSICIGHSLGGLLLESALTELIENPDDGIELPDLTVFLNTAAAAGVSTRLHDLCKERPPARKEISHDGVRFKGPRLISVAANSDPVTQLVFRVAKGGAVTGGNTEELHTHEFKRLASPVVCRALSDVSFGQSWHCLRPPQDVGGKIVFDLDLPPPGPVPIGDGSDHVRFRITQETDSSFWAFRVPGGVIDGHGDIFNERAGSFLLAMTQLSGAIMSLATDYESTFDSSDYSESSSPASRF